MQTFRKQPIALFYFCLLLITAVAVWLSQNSINAYWEQTYHQSSPLQSLSQYAWWQKGGELQHRANARYAHLKAEWEQVQFGSSSLNVAEAELPLAQSVESATENAMVLSDNLSSVTVEQTTEQLEKTNSVIELQAGLPIKTDEHIDQTKPVVEHIHVPTVPVANDDVSVTAVQPQPNSEITPEETVKIAQNVEPVKPNVKASVYTISVRDKVLFAGDSLMQGVAPWVRKWLIQHNVKSIDLSKQSTGLSYPSFFDWPTTIEKTLRNDPSIKLLVMFLGANDPWDFADPNKPWQRLKFKSPEWEAVYIQRMERILHAAEKNHVRIIWLGVPYMKSAKLNEQMRYLDKVYKTQITPRGIFLPTETLLSNGNGKYADSVPYQGKTVKVRSKDGIHFTPTGQKILAELIQKHLTVQE